MTKATVVFLLHYGVDMHLNMMNEHK